MKIRQVCICVITMLHPMVLNAATKSLSTPKIVGFKPWYENSTGFGAFSGRLETSSTITVDANKLKYIHKFGLQYPENINERKYIWLLDDREVGTASSYTLPDDSEGKILKIKIMPSSKQGDPKEGKVLTITDFARAGVEGGTKDGKISVNKTAPQIKELQMTGELKPNSILIGTYYFDPRGGDPRDASKYAWIVPGDNSRPSFKLITDTGKVPERVITANDVGKTIQLTVNSFNGKNIPGNSLTVQTPQPIKAVPTISNLKLVGTYQAGGTIKADYIYHANKGGEEGYTRFQYGEKGTTANLDQFMQGNLKQIPQYQVTRSDIGKVIEVSVRPISKGNTEGDIYTSSADYAVPNSTPKRVDIDVDKVSNVEDSSVAGHPIVNKSTMTAKLTLSDAKPGQPIFDLPELYYYVWKVGGNVVQAGNKMNTYKAPVNLQGQEVVVEVIPGNLPAH